MGSCPTRYILILYIGSGAGGITQCFGNVGVNFLWDSPVDRRFAFSARVGSAVVFAHITIPEPTFWKIAIALYVGSAGGSDFYGCPWVQFYVSFDGLGAMCSRMCSLPKRVAR